MLFLWEEEWEWWYAGTALMPHKMRYVINARLLPKRWLSNNTLLEIFFQCHKFLVRQGGELFF